MGGAERVVLIDDADDDEEDNDEMLSARSLIVGRDTEGRPLPVRRDTDFRRCGARGERVPFPEGRDTECRPLPVGRGTDFRRCGARDERVPPR